MHVTDPRAGRTCPADMSDLLSFAFIYKSREDERKITKPYVTFDPSV